VLVFHHFAVLRTGGACSLVAENAQPFSVIRIFFSMQITKALNSDESLGKNLMSCTISNNTDTVYLSQIVCLLQKQNTNLAAVQNPALAYDSAKILNKQ